MSDLSEQFVKNNNKCAARCSKCTYYDFRTEKSDKFFIYSEPHWILSIIRKEKHICINCGTILTEKNVEYATWRERFMRIGAKSCGKEVSLEEYYKDTKKLLQSLQ